MSQHSLDDEVLEDATLDESDSGCGSNTSSFHQLSSHPQPASLGENVSSSNNSTVLLPDIVPSASISSSDFLNESYTDEEVEEYVWMMDYKLKEEFHDVLVLSCEDDDNLVEEFCKGLNKILLRNKKPPKVIKCSDFSPEVTSKITNLEFALERCTYIFLFLTNNFVNDTWTKFSGETCLMEAITNPKKQWCVVPVFTEPKRSCSFKIPPSLNSLKGVQYSNDPDDQRYKESVKNILDRNLHIRLRNEDNLMKKRKKWIKDFKTKKYFRQKQEEEKQKQHSQMLETRISSTLHSRCINKQLYETMYPGADADHIYPVGAVSVEQMLPQSYSETTYNSLDPNVSEDAASFEPDSHTLPRLQQLNQGPVLLNMPAVSQDNLPSDRDVTYSPQTCVTNTGEPDLTNMAPKALEDPAAAPFRSTHNSSLQPFNLECECEKLNLK